MKKKLQFYSTRFHDFILQHNIKYAFWSQLFLFFERICIPNLLSCGTVFLIIMKWKHEGLCYEGLFFEDKHNCLASSGSRSGSERISVFVHRYFREFKTTERIQWMTTLQNDTRSIDLPGLRSPSVQCCSTHKIVDLYKSSILDVETTLLKDTNRGLKIRLNCFSLRKFF